MRTALGIGNLGRVMAKASRKVGHFIGRTTTLAGPDLRLIWSPVHCDPRGRLYWVCRPPTDSDLFGDLPFIIERDGEVLLVLEEGRLFDWP